MSNSENYTLTLSPTSRNHSQITKLLTRLTGNAFQARKISTLGGEIPLAFSKSKAEEEAAKFRALGAVIEMQETAINAYGLQYAVMLIDGGQKKVEVIKAVRAVTGLSLSEAKKIVDNGGLVKIVNEETHANTIKTVIEDAGATVEIIVTGESEIHDEKEPIDQPEPDNKVYAYYKLILIASGPNKLDVIKYVRAHLGVSLEEANNLVNSHGVIYSSTNLLAVESFKSGLEHLGAEVEIDSIEENQVDNIPDELFEEIKLHYSVYGLLQKEDAIPLEGIRVQLFDRDIRQLQFLGEAISDKNGNFNINFFEKSFEDEESFGPDLVFKFFHPNGITIPQFSSDSAGVPIGEDLVFFNVGKKSRYIFSIQSSSLNISEYENLVYQLAPSIGTISFAELEWEDIIFLHHDTKISIQEIFKVIDDEVVGSDLGLPEGFIYALLNQDIATYQYPLEETMGSIYPEYVKRIDLGKLLTIPVDFLFSKIERAIQKGMIPKSGKVDDNSLKEILGNQQKG
ncbi:ribosomal protein L7/L12 [Mongoliibacter ruber]|uniref:Ribosomal L7/L12-like protein n=1 Tax=Mongoliibacter ruber TaxID=1750599 RepID=A0A2T0WGU5_9BACT|nr:ribosomal protein L7/L12 [Mongoliibacter ruber]PRY85892.1 ribosomal L7/L12-like protein [Mongoliibacter ruber]